MAFPAQVNIFPKNIPNIFRILQQLFNSHFISFQYFFIDSNVLNWISLMFSSSSSREYLLQNNSLKFKTPSAFVLEGVSVG